ncbi:MAG TPA: cation diffusion facilitator family transporter [Oleiagrimonas sp.]|nr:cation diffusion facilitator family transporter [Oleiagrimonas sp.]
MHHPHSHPPHSEHAAHGSPRESRLLLALGLTLTMLVLEAVGGWWSGSLALLTDAAHMLVDALTLLMAVVAVLMARKPADARRSYGYGRIEVLSGFVSALFQVVLIVFIVYEAIGRLLRPEPILSDMMLWVAVAGFIINMVVLRMLHHHDPDDVNMGGARLHVLGDLLGSAGAVIAAILIGSLGWLRADPILSLLVSLLILRSAWSLLRRCSHILLEGVPEGLETVEMLEVLRAAHAGICDVHHLHVWQLASGSRVATLHAGLHAGADGPAVMRAVKQVLRERYGIDHATVQIEPESCPDTLAECGEHDHS